MSAGPPTSDPPAALWRLSQVLRTLAVDTGFDDLRDALWLARHLPRHKRGRKDRRSAGQPAATSTTTATAAAAAGPGADERSATPAGHMQTRRVALGEDDAPAAAVYAGASADGGSAARRIRLPAPHPLPDALAIGRALQPVTRRRPQGAAVLLDEEATAEAIAHTGLMAPVLRQRRERWFDLLLVVDNAPSMVVWRARIDEFELLLRRAGFRDVRRAALHSGPEDPVPTLRARSGLVLQAGDTAAGAATSGRLLLVVSDAAAAPWHDGRISALLQPWARTMAVALVQPLPAALWPHTAVGFAELRVSASTPGQPGDSLHQSRPGWARGEAGFVLPVLALQADAVAAWARMVMAAGDAWCRAALLPAADEAPAPGAATAAGSDDAPLRLLASFRAAATPDALELAAAYAVIRPLNLPVMRLIQAVMLPAAGADALAQVLMSGLLRVQTTVATDDEGVVYEIDDAVRDELAGHLTRSRWLQVNLAVQRFVEIETGVGFDFVAFIEDRLGLEQVALSAMPFAQLAARMADRFVPGRVGGSGKRRYAHEPVFGPGLTVQAQAQTATPVRRLAWSPSGQSLAVLHARGVDVLAPRNLAPQRRERLAASVLLWAVRPAELELLRPLMDRVCEVAEATWNRPFVNHCVSRISALADEPHALLRVLPLMPSWTGVELRELATPALRALEVNALLLAQQQGAPLPASKRLLLRDWSGALQRPLGSPQTRTAIEALCAKVTERVMFQTLDGPGAIDAMAWSETNRGEGLHIVGRQNLLPQARTGVYLEGALIRELDLPPGEDCVVVEYASQTGSLTCQQGGATWIDLANGSPPAFRGDGACTARYAPDGRTLALIDARGELHLLQVGPRASR